MNILKKACLNTYHCLGYSSSGALKMEIETSTKWTRSSQENLFVLGKDRIPSY